MPKTNAEKLGIRPASTLEVINAPAGPSPIGELPVDVAVNSVAMSDSPAETDPAGDAGTPTSFSSSQTTSLNFAAPPRAC